MTVGKGGVYDAEAAELLVRLQSQGIILVVTNGSRGSGFSLAMLHAQTLRAMPGVLENVAKQIREDLKKLADA